MTCLQRTKDFWTLDMFADDQIFWILDMFVEDQEFLEGISHANVCGFFTKVPAK